MYNDLEFPKLLKKKQEELNMNNTQFARYLGRHRGWLGYVYSNDFDKAHKLTEPNMVTINRKLGIPFEVMFNYNMTISQSRVK